MLDFVAIMEDADALRGWLSERALELEVVDAPRRLEGGLLNHTWYVEARPVPVVIKFAPPHLASAPSIPLDPARQSFEVRALEAFARPGPLADLARREGVRVPRCIWSEASPRVLIMDWIASRGDFVHASTDAGAAEDARALARFVVGMHRATFEDDTLAERFDNTAVQRTRLVVQYEPLGELLAELGISDAASLGEGFAELGRRFTTPGCCLIMGDLWPRSILAAPETLALIDWEFAHFGRPAQDIGHLAAHLWMHAHCGAPGAALRFEAFLEACQLAMEGAPAPLREPLREEASWHCAAEILTRAVGAFREGFLYHREPVDGARLGEAIDAAISLARAPERGVTHLLTMLP